MAAGTASRQRTCARWPYPAHATPSHAIRAYIAATNEHFFSTQQYSCVRSTDSKRLYCCSILCVLPCSTAAVVLWGTACRPVSARSAHRQSPATPDHRWFRQPTADDMVTTLAMQGLLYHEPCEPFGSVVVPLRGLWGRWFTLVRGPPAGHRWAARRGRRRLRKFKCKFCDEPPPGPYAAKKIVK